MPDSLRPLTEDRSKDILIWDAEGVPDAWPGIAVLWSGFGVARDVGDRLISMPSVVEGMADDLRSCYLEWLHDLGKASVDGQTVSEHLLIRPGLSYWWMAAPAQKYSISAISLIPDAIKLLALERYMSGVKARAVVLHSSNLRLAECLDTYCRLSGLSFEWRHPAPVKPSDRYRQKGYARLPRLMRAVLSFGWYCVSRLPTLYRNRAKPRPKGRISFFDVLVHLDKRGIASGRFISNYWGPLVAKLSSDGLTTNWFHFFHPHPAVSSYTDADNLVRQFDESAGERQFHALVDTLPSAIAALRAWRDFLQLRRMTGLVAKASGKVRPKASTLDLWPLHEDEWVESVAGPNALMECLRLGMFEAVLARLPKQQVGVYICENQPWEMSLIHAWRTGGHGQLVAAPHTTVRFWDLRYFHDPRVYVSGDASGIPLPDCYAVNGPVARMALLIGGCPEERVVEVEALRFMHLTQLQNRATEVGRLRRILVCGDFLSATNDRILEWLDYASQNLSKGAIVIFKPHPAFPYNPDSAIAERVGLRLDERPLMELLPDSDIVITSAITSAAVDAYCAGKRVIQIADGGGLNANALRGLEGVSLATTPDALSAALQAVPTSTSGAVVPYFRLDSQLPEWLRLLRTSPVVDELQFSTEAGGH